MKFHVVGGQIILKGKLEEEAAEMDAAVLDMQRQLCQAITGIDSEVYNIKANYLELRFFYDEGYTVKDVKEIWAHYKSVKNQGGVL